MASEDSRDGKATIELPSEVADWLDEEHPGQAEAVAAQLLEAYRQLDGAEVSIADPAVWDGNRPVTETELDERLADLDGTIEELIDDVRKRVLQLKRDTERKAAADHDHDELHDRIEETGRRLDDIEQQAQSAAERATAVESSLDAGFENYEEILTYLTEETDRLADRLDVLARVVIELRSEVETAAADRARREAVDDLKRAANQHGIRTAECGACSATVDIGLLTAPNCPQCTERFVDVSAGKRFFHANVLDTGDPPALTGAEVPDELGEEFDDAFAAAESREAPDWTPPGESDE